MSVTAVPPGATVPPAPDRARARAATGLAFVAAVSFLAGMTDAIGFLSAGDFVSFMSGNTTRLAVSLSHGDPWHAAHLALILVLFVLGNTLGVLVTRSGRWTPLLLLIVSGLLFGAWLPAGGGPSQAWLLGAIVLAMGLLNAGIERVGDLHIGVTYVTGALSRVGRGLGRWILGDRRNDWPVNIVPWIGMIAGAVSGGLCHSQSAGAALLVAAGVAALIAVVAMAIPRPWRDSYLAERGPVAARNGLEPGVATKDARPETR
ncbi:YoaK family protein [Mangrovicella endophytica]|uniref:YoaK family protein n=1 Tax=Mangrovicella endophytica TaxID=2066697 RepID=UPI000C9E88FB|nr:YoaK family protein [Mangrovicella endophytica]